jgi:antagonist of KipI
MAAMSVVKAGMQTTVQDAGRWGYQASGVSVSGAMDLAAHRVANALVGNAPTAATLEITLVGPELRFDDERSVAVTGAAFGLTVNGEIAQAMNSSVRVPTGARVTFGARLSGARAYLAVGGGIDVPIILGSRSTHLPSEMGGFMGRSLRAGDRLPLGSTSNTGSRDVTRSVANREQRSTHQGPVTLRVMLGPHAGRFPSSAFEALLSSPYVVGTDSNRIGYRLDGPFIRRHDSADLLSDATTIGAVQIPASGQPILLMADRPATGGYPRIATVITADIPRAAQLAPGDVLQFTSCAREEAIEALDAQERELRWTVGRP